MRDGSQGGRKAAIMAGIASFIVLAIAAVHLLPKIIPEGGEPKLAGEWTLSLPAGFKHTVTLTPSEDGGYELNRLVFAGLYKVENQHLIMVKPRDARLTQFRWKIEAVDKLTLVAPRVSPTGGSYLGATLTRNR